MSAARAIALLWACAWLSAARAHAQAHPGFAIALRAPERAECTSAEQLSERVEARAGRPARAAEGAATLAVTVEITADADAHGYRALVSVADERGRARGQRELSAAGACAALDEMLVLVIASSVGVSAQAPAPAPLLEPAPPLPPPEPRPASASTNASSPAEPIVIGADLPPADSAAPSSPPEPPGASAPWRIDLEGSGRALTGTLPDPALAVGGALFVEHGALGLRAAGAWLPSATARSELPLRIAGGFGELGLCARALHTASLALLFCAAAQAGALHAEAAPLWQRTPRWDGLLQLAPSASLRAQLLPGAGLALALGTTIPLVFPRYSYRSAAGDDVPLHEVELGAFAELALWIRLNP